MAAPYTCALEVTEAYSTLRVDLGLLHTVLKHLTGTRLNPFLTLDGQADDWKRLRIMELAFCFRGECFCLENRPKHIPQGTSGPESAAWILGQLLHSCVTQVSPSNLCQVSSRGYFAQEVNQNSKFVFRIEPRNACHSRPLPTKPPSQSQSVTCDQPWAQKNKNKSPEIILNPVCSQQGAELLHQYALSSNHSFDQRIQATCVICIQGHTAALWAV